MGRFRDRLNECRPQKMTLGENLPIAENKLPLLFPVGIRNDPKRSFRGTVVNGPLKRPLETFADSARNARNVVQGDRI